MSNTKTDSRMIFNKSWQGAQGVIVLMDTEFQFGKMKKFGRWIGVMVLVVKNPAANA